MSKTAKTLHNLTVLAIVRDGRGISKLEKILSAYGDIESDYGMRAGDGKGRRPIVNIVYLVSTSNPGKLKNALANNKFSGIETHIL